MFKGFIKGLKQHIYAFFVRFDESLEQRYDSKIREAEALFEKIEKRVQGTDKSDYAALLKSFEALSVLTENFERQSAGILKCIEDEFPEMRGKFANMFEAVVYLKAQYRELKANERL